MVVRQILIILSLIALIHNAVSLSIPGVPINPELVVARHNYTGFHTSSTHMDFDHHVDFLDHQTKVLWSKVSKELDELDIPAQIRERDEARKEDPTLRPFTILDLGGASGSLASLVLERFPTTRGICVDIEHKFLIRGVAKFQPLVAADRLRYVHASSSQTTLPSESVDLVLSQFVFQHLYNITGTLDELVRVMAPGATVLVIDADTHLHDVVFPMPPTLRLAQRLHHLHQRKNVAGLESGVLLRFLRDALSAWGMQGAREHVVVTSSQEDGSEHYWPLLAPTQYYALVRHGDMSKKAFDAAVAEFGAWRAAAERVFFMKCVVAMWSARKPVEYRDKKGQVLSASDYLTEITTQARARLPAALDDFERQVKAGLARASRRAAREESGEGSSSAWGASADALLPEDGDEDDEDEDEYPREEAGEDHLARMLRALMTEDEEEAGVHSGRETRERVAADAAPRTPAVVSAGSGPLKDEL